MHAQKTFLKVSTWADQSTVLRLAVVMAIATPLLLSSAADAQSGKYKRAMPKAAAAATPATPAPTPAAGTGTTPPAAGTATPAAGAAATPPANGEKVDISDLEQRYWAPKDTEFSVVQNRLYSKAKRFAVTASWGPMINDTYADGSIVGFSANYYFSERTGVELMYNKISARQNIVVQGLISKGGLPDHNLPQTYTGVAFNWVPFYAKMSVLEKKIIYFDMSFSPGMGFTQYEQQTIDNQGANLSAFTMSFDVAQHYFLNQNIAIRLDMRNRVMNQDIVSWRTKLPIRTERLNNTSILLGLQYYF